MNDDLGTLEKTDGRWRLQFVRRLPHPPDKVWRALTEPEHLDAWFPTTIEGERAVGAKLRFAFPFDDAPDMEGQMLACDPPSLLEFTFGEGEELRFELSPDAHGGGTVMTFASTFDELGKAARDGAGWHACLDLLRYHLAAEKPPFDPDKRWAEVHPRYVEALGPEAATIGPPDWYPEAK